MAKKQKGVKEKEVKEQEVKITDFKDLKERAKKFVLGRYAKYKDRSGLETRWQKNNKAYYGISHTKFYQGTANLFVPETFNSCKALVNFADEVLHSDKGQVKFDIKGVGGENEDKRGAFLKKLMNLQDEKVKIRSKRRKALRSLVKDGIVIAKTPHVTREKYIYTNSGDRDVLMDMLQGKRPKEKVLKKKITIYDNIDFEVKDLSNMFWDYYATWDEQDCIIERKQVTTSHLLKGERNGIYTGIKTMVAEKGATKSIKTGTSGKAPEDITSKTEKNFLTELTGLNTNFKTTSEYHELLECWFDFDIDEDGIKEECLISIVDNEYVVRLGLNPYDIQEKPFLWSAWEEIDGTSLGLGVPQLAEKSQIALNDFTNQIMDNITSIINNMKIVDDMAQIPEWELKSRPNGIIHSRTGVEAVKPLAPQLTANEGLKAVAMTKDDIRTVTNANAAMQGLPAKYDTTATEIKQMTSASARDVFSKLRDIEDNLIKPYYRKSYSYIRQFMSRDDFIKILGKEAIDAFGLLEDEVEDLSEALAEDIDFIPYGASQMLNKVVVTQQMINFLNIVSSGKIPPGTVDFRKLIKLIWSNINDRDDIIIPEPKSILMSPDDENIILSQGEIVEASLNEPHENHIRVHTLAEVPEVFENLKQMHIQQHMQMMQMLQSGQGGGVPGAPSQPQNQPRVAPDEITSASAGEVPNLPVEV